ncbi:hypothetical protein Curi_c20850 [Gottschalkia acidurici 9a]|uniref:Uncharacterized protein n=1 Tax=Gottschalkia acidurici (strain ATCC 7906 / DSM 604 / BCRC 14475 / CIP 104303 / KCTC 5404 / NCIMB 10678 / 9a) TaxID=1128398 RepID=K0B0N4_GOTA9|nr:hypothetical protein [Gottschalkia acidurici]AFS79089.1 hypothetical protein Curi_c20850 [Gottschalkia acidurici 9a]
MFKFNKDKNDLEIDIEYDSITRSVIPLLIEDRNWISLFNKIEEKDIIDLKEKLSSLVKENRSSKKELTTRKSEKKKLIAKILTLSDEINNNDLVEGVDLLGEYEEKLHEANENIDELTFKTETIPSQIRATNLELLRVTIKYAYKDIIYTEKKLSELDKELTELRERLRIAIKEKYDNEEKRNTTYAFLHNVLGGKEVDKLDKNILD